MKCKCEFYRETEDGYSVCEHPDIKRQPGLYYGLYFRGAKPKRCPEKNERNNEDA